MFCMCRSVEVRPKLLCRWYQGSEAGDRPSFSFHSRLCLQGSSSGALPPTEDTLPLHRRPVLTILGTAGAKFYNCCCNFYCFYLTLSFLQLASRMLDKIQRGHKVKAEDIKMVLASVVHKGKVTVWNQLFMLHSEVKTVFASFTYFCSHLVLI